MGRSLMGPITNNEYLTLKDAGWNEKLASAILITGILIMGLTPFLVNDLIYPSTKSIMLNIQRILP
jgi:NADH:ubiquinone oxidoreductase subunit 4 (subunit M)